MYEIHDTYGAPQCGVEIVKFDYWYELEEYLDQHPEVNERIENGYATICER